MLVYNQSAVCLPPPQGLKNLVFMTQYRWYLQKLDESLFFPDVDILILVWYWESQLATRALKQQEIFKIYKGGKTKSRFSFTFFPANLFCFKNILKDFKCFYIRSTTTNARKRKLVQTSLLIKGIYLDF